MAWNYVEITPSPIPNTTVFKMLDGGECKGHTVTPNEGYLLHDAAYDTEAPKDETGQRVGKPLLGYRTDPAVCSGAYDFDNTFDVENYTAYGSRAFFAVSKSACDNDSDAPKES